MKNESTTLKGHGAKYYFNNCQKCWPLIIEISENREAYSRQYVEQLQETYEQNRAVVMAYQIINGNKFLNA